jgi:integration host factor subunit alpha
MGGKTLTRADLAEAVVRKVGLPRNESQDLVELILSEISVALATGESVKLSSFGSFGIRQKGERLGRNPKTGKEVPITPRRVLVFRPSNVMKERINAGAKRKPAAGETRVKPPVKVPAKVAVTKDADVKSAPRTPRKASAARQA